MYRFAVIAPVLIDGEHGMRDIEEPLARYSRIESGRLKLCRGV